MYVLEVSKPNLCGFHVLFLDILNLPLKWHNLSRYLPNNIVYTGVFFFNLKTLFGSLTNSKWIKILQINVGKLNWQVLESTKVLTRYY